MIISDDKNYQFIDKNNTLNKALYFLNKNKNKCLIVLDNKMKLIGTLTDGDVRRAILNGAEFDDRIFKFVNKKPYYLKYKKKKNFQISRIAKRDYKIIPVIDNSRVLKDVITPEDNKIFKKYFNKKGIQLKNISTVIMAGGLGKRLLPHTSVIPKPLLPIRGKSMIENVISTFKSYNLNKFYITINYKSELLKSYFSNFDKKYNIKLVQEKFSMGTAGSLRLIKDKLKNSFFVINCDSLIFCDFISLYQYHEDNKFALTVVVSKKKNQIPYGVCKTNKKGQLLNIDEKPKVDFLANTGFYVIHPKVLNLISKSKPLDMNELIEKLFKKKLKVGVFPINENEWQDLSNWPSSE